MDQPKTNMLRIGAWRVNPASGQISRDGQSTRLETRTTRLLMCLANRAPEVVSIDELLTEVWPDVTVSPDSVYQAVASLRRQLGDDPKQPAYIETVPRLGYRMLAEVGPWTTENGGQPASLRVDGEAASPPANRFLAPGPRLRPRFLLATITAICAALVAAYLVSSNLAKNGARESAAAPAPQEKSIAVLPFLDLTEHMAAEEFADGMTEELIDKLTKIPGLRVTPPTSSFYYKNKQVPVAEIAKSLGVSYVLDGSVRKSDTHVRIAARLTRADTGYVVWSETYDHPFDDVVTIQDDIAVKVTQALRASIESSPDNVSSP